MFWLFLGNVQVQLFGAVPKETFILAFSLFPPRLLNPARLYLIQVQLKPGSQRATGTSARESEPEGSEGRTVPRSCLL